MKPFNHSFVKFVIFGLALFCFTAGCSTLQKNKRTPATPLASEKKDSAQKAVYYDFPDVLIPGELMLNRELSSIYQADNNPGGILTFDSHVEVSSLVNFFEVSMVNDGWRIEGKYKSRRSYLLFNKGERNCVIIITVDYFNTQVEIWVTTTLKDYTPGVHQTAPADKDKRSGEMVF